MSYLPANPLAAHVAAFEAEDYKEFLRLINEQPPNSSAELQVLHELLDEFAVRRLPRYRAQWDKRVGAFLMALGIVGTGGAGAERFFTSWEWEDSYERLALTFAQANLKDEQARGSRFNLSYAGELVSIGWRGVLLGRLQTVVAAEPVRFISALARVPPTASERTDQAELLLRTVAFEQLGGALDSSDYWWELWKPFSSGRDGGDTAGHALKLLGARARRLR